MNGQTVTSVTTAFQTAAMLAVLKISSWTARKHDKRVTAEVAYQHGAPVDSGRYTKQLIAKDALKQIASIDSAARTLHYTLTLPWSDDGARILPAKLYQRYADAMQDFRDKREQAVPQFVASYPALVADAAARLGGLFNQADYPAAADISSKFAFEVRFLPVPESGHFVVDVAQQEQERIRTEIDTHRTATVNAAVQSLWTRMHEAVSHMATKLAEYRPDDGTGKAAGIFRDSLVGNVRQLAQLLPDLNVTGDRQLAEMADRLQRELCAYDPDALRANDGARTDVAKAAADILADMAGYL